MKRELRRFGTVFARVLILVAVIHGWNSAFLDAQTIELGEYTLDHKQLKEAVYGRGFNIGLDEKAIDKLMEIQQHLQNAQWVKAFRIIDANRKLWAGKQVPRQDGFTLPVDEFLARLIASLPAEARESFESYFTARAKQLLARANSLPPDEGIAELRRLQTYYSLTSAGSESANHLGDAYFEKGSFRQAATVWETLIRDHSLGLDFEKRILSKLVLAYARTGNQEGLANTLATLSQRFAGEDIKVGPDEQLVEDFVAAYANNSERVNSQVVTLPVAQLPKKAKKATWGVDWTTDQKKSGLPAAIPDVRFDGNQFTVNHGWAVATYDLETGDVVWSEGLAKKGKGNLFGLVKRIVQENAAIAVRTNSRNQQKFGDAERQVASNGTLTFVQRVDKDQNVKILAFESNSGRLAWASSTNAEFKIVGNIVAWQDMLVAAAYSTKSQSELHLLFYDSEGNLDSTQRLGTVVGIHNPYYGTAAQPSPTLVTYGQYVLVMPNDGAVIAIDPESDEKIDWIFRFSAARSENASNNRIFWSGMQLPKTYIRPSATVKDDILYFRDDEESTLHAMNPAKRKVLWKRSMAKDARILGVDDRFLFVLAKEPDGGHTLQMIDRVTQEMVHCPRLPKFVNGRFVIGKENVLVSTNRGIYRASKTTGDIEMPFRNELLPAQEHALFLQENHLIAVTESHLQVFDVTE